MDTIDILVTKMSSVKLGLNMSQIERIYRLSEEKNTSAKLIYIHKILPFHQDSISYKSPHIFMLKTFETPFGIIIDEPQKMINIPVKEISPLPYLIKQTCVNGSIWGAVEEDSTFILLLDVIRLIKTDQV